MMLLHQGLRIANKLLTSQEKCDLRTIVSVDSANAELAKRHITFELLAYLILVTASRMCVDIRALGKEMSLTNPLQGLMFWYIVEHFFMNCVTVHGIPVPGLSMTDAVGTGLSSFHKVAAIMATRDAELTAACTRQKVPLPDLDGFFFLVQPSGAEGDDEAGEHEEEG